MSLLFLQKCPKGSSIEAIETADSTKLAAQEIHIYHDSIVREIIRTDTLIKYVEEESNRNNFVISNQSVDADILYFTEYINSYNR